MQINIIRFLLLLLLTYSTAPLAQIDSEVFLEGATVTGIAQDGDILWIATYGQGIYKFSTLEQKWENFLSSKGYSPKSFVNPKNKWYYVYVYTNEDLKKVYKTYKNLIKLDFFNEIWVYKINM